MECRDDVLWSQVRLECDKMLFSKFVKLRWGTKERKYYIEKGYKFTKWKDEFIIKVEDLPRYSQVRVLIKCDYCGRLQLRKYGTFNCSHESKHNLCDKDACSNCTELKTKENNMLRFGVDSTSKLDSVKEKIRNTCFEKYGVTCPLKAEEVKEKIKKTNLERLGVEYPTQNDEVKAKVAMAFYKNGLCRTSQQQNEIFDVLTKYGLDVELNYLESRCLLDVAVFKDGRKVNVEYDGYFWHRNRAAYDRRRDEFLKKNGWQIIRIKGSHKLPSEIEIINSVIRMINSDRRYLCIYADDYPIEGCN